MVLLPIPNLNARVRVSLCLLEITFFLTLTNDFLVLELSFYHNNNSDVHQSSWGNITVISTSATSDLIGQLIEIPLFSKRANKYEIQHLSMK